MMPTITGEIVALTKYNKVASAKVKTENGTTDVRYWMSAPFADQMAEGATVTLELEKKPQRDDPTKSDTFVTSCNGVGDRPQGGGNRPGGGGGGGRPQENPKDKTAVMLTSYAKDLIVNVEGMTPADAAEMVATMFLIIRAKISQVVNT